MRAGDCDARRGAVEELRLVLPAAAIESHRHSTGNEASASAPQLLSYDPPLPRWLAACCGGCWRVRVRAEPPTQGGEVSHTEYRCSAPALPVQVLIVLDTVALPGDCTEHNALNMRPETLFRRSTSRVEIGGADAAGRSGQDSSLCTVYCCLGIRVLRRRLLGPFGFLVVFAVRPYIEGAARAAAGSLLQRHWHCIARRWAATAGSEAAAPPAARLPSAEPPDASAAGGGPAAPGLATDRPPPPPPPPEKPAVHTEPTDGRYGGGHLQRSSSPAFARPGSPTYRPLPPGQAAAEGDSPGSTPRAAAEAALVQPSLNKGMPFYNGFLYKLGDGLVNTSWNLRYFLLIGQSLQYYRSQHEARPRDIFNLSDATVEWVKDQSRPFAFTVSKTGQRLLCLAGNTEQETREWVDRIQAACKVSEEGQQPTTPLDRKGRPSTMLGLAFGTEADATELAETPASPEAEAALRACAQALGQAASGEGFRLAEVQDGVRITERSQGGDVSPMASGEGGRAALLALLLCLLPLFAATGLPLGRSLPAALILLALVRLALFGGGEAGGGAAPEVCATVQAEATNEELKDLLTDPSFQAQWCPGHIEGALLSLAPAKDDIVHMRFELGLLGLTTELRARRRWIRSSDGVRLLCSVAEAEGYSGGVAGYEGFAIVPGDDGTSTVLWLCRLELAPWAPRALRRRCALRRVRALAGLRAWLGCPAGKQRSLSTSAPGREAAPARAEARCDYGGLLKGFRRAAGDGGLHLPGDLERAALSAQVALGVVRQALLGRQELALTASPAGLQLQAGTDLAHRYAARWAYASLFLPDAGATEGPRDRMVRVVAFMVAGLHLAAASYPHMPWVLWGSGGAAKHAIVLGDDTRVRVDVAASQAASASRPASTRRCRFEVLSRAAHIFGTDEVLCRMDSAGGFRFRDRGTTTVEFSPGGAAVRFSSPEFRVRPSGWSFGSGSVFEWCGAAHFVDEVGGVQCDLSFGTEGPDSVRGAVRDILGIEIGRIRGSWLGPVLCDDEVLWRGPRQKPATF